jgi:uncharacterized protein
MQIYAIRFNPGEDLKHRLDRLCWERNWRAACVLSCVGSLDCAKLRFAGHGDVTNVRGPLEIVSLSGTLASFGGSHLHLAVSDSKGHTIGGHLKDGSIVHTTAEIVIGVLDGLSFHREFDARTGYPELVITAE